jgi:glutamate carboxypeptidase
VPDTTAEMTDMARWWPMEKLERSGRSSTSGRARDRLGFEVKDTSTGGRPTRTRPRDGIPSLDGLGPIGGNDHSPAEYMDVASVVPRTTLVAALLLAIGRDPVVSAGERARHMADRRLISSGGP